jgi:hypothetical protein
MAGAAAAELAMGRKPWGMAGVAGLWCADAAGSCNSQYLLDPYSFTHLTHGVLLYAALWLAARRLPLRWRLVLAVLVESAWEVLENTAFVIERYRSATISRHYYGDSVVNSMGDIAVCALGFTLASRLSTRISAAGVVAMELLLAWTIRDGFFLNVLMLLGSHPAIHAWQLAR